MTNEQIQRIFKVMRASDSNTMDDLIAAIGPDPIELKEWKDVIIFQEAVRWLSTPENAHLVNTLNLVVDKKIFDEVMLFRNIQERAKQSRNS